MEALNPKIVSLQTDAITFHDPEQNYEVIMQYSDSEPYACTFQFLNAGEGGADENWTFARSLILDALIQPVDGTTESSGVYFSQSQYDQTEIRLDLTSETGSKSLVFDRKALSKFIIKTLELVPEGSELLNIDIDQAFTQLDQDHPGDPEG